MTEAEDSQLKEKSCASMGTGRMTSLLPRAGSWQRLWTTFSINLYFTLFADNKSMAERNMDKVSLIIQSSKIGVASVWAGASVGAEVGASARVVLVTSGT